MELGNEASNTTQHALNFGVRGADYRSHTADGTASAPDMSQEDTLWYNVRIVWKEFSGRALGDSYLAVTGGGQVNTPDPIEAGPDYYLRIISESQSHTKASLWKAQDGEESAVSRQSLSSYPWPPNLCILNAENVQADVFDDTAMRSTIAVQSAIINPAAGILDDECSDAPTSRGSRLETLFHRDYYWRPQNTEISYYTQVYFDGIPVTEGTEYHIEDTYKIVPNDFSLPHDTVLTALVVVQ